MLAIGNFFFREGISDEWLARQLLAMSKAGFAPGESYHVMDRLVKASPSFPNLVAEVLASLVKNPHFDRWVYMHHAGGVRTIFVNGLATGTPATATAIVEGINYLATMGYTGYLGLLPARDGVAPQ